MYSQFISSTYYEELQVIGSINFWIKYLKDEF